MLARGIMIKDFWFVKASFRTGSRSGINQTKVLTVSVWGIKPLIVNGHWRDSES